MIRKFFCRAKVVCSFVASRADRWAAWPDAM